jgi:hypothetical protein
VVQAELVDNEACNEDTIEHVAAIVEMVAAFAAPRA